MDLSSTIRPFSYNARKDILSETTTKNTMKQNEKNIEKNEKSHNTQTKLSSSEFSKTTNTSVFSSEDIKFGENSLWLFKSDNKIRIIIQKIVFHKSFTITIDLLIIINSIFLVFETIKRFLNLSQILNTLFTLIFTIEGLLKIISFGFILDENSYLRDPWNWIDFFVIITGLISIIPGIYTNWTALRVFRLLRTIKTIKLFPNVRRFVNVVLNSLIDLTAVFFMLFFFCLVFSVLGLSLWNDRFNYLCRKNEKPINGKLIVDANFFYTLCGGKNKCNNRPELCLSSFNYYKNSTFFMSRAYYWDDELNNEYFNYGLTNFDNIFKSFLISFLITTGEGWSKIMYLMIDGYNYYISVLYFIIAVVTNYFFMIKLTIAVLLYKFEKSRSIIHDLEYNIRQRNPGKNKLFRISYQKKLLNENNQLKYKKKYPNVKIRKGQKFLNFHSSSIGEFFHSIISYHCFKYIPKKTDYHKKFCFGYICYYLINQPFIQIFFFLCIIINAVILSFQNDTSPQKEIQIINIVLVTLFTIEQILLIFGYGLKLFFSRIIYVVDLIIIILSNIELFLKRNKEGTKTSVFSVFRVLKIIRLIKIFRTWVQFQIIMESIIQTAYRMLDFIFVFIIILYMYALLGYSLFNNSLKMNRNGQYNAKKSSYEYNFDSFLNSLLSVFLIIIGDHWNDIFYQCYRSSRNNDYVVLIYFLTLVSFGQIILMNVFLAYLIDSFEKSCWNLERNVYVRKNYLYLYFALFRIFKSEEIEKRRGLKVNDVEDIFKEYIALSNKKKLAKKGKLVLIGKSNINYITNKAVINEDYLTLHKNKKFKNVKELKFPQIFQETRNLESIERVKIDNLKSYNFIIDYTQKYEEDENPIKFKTLMINDEEIKLKIQNKLENAYINNNKENIRTPPKRRRNKCLGTEITKRKKTIFEKYGITDGKIYLLGLNNGKQMKEREEPIKRQTSLYFFKNKLDLLGNQVHEKPIKKKEKNILVLKIKPPLKVRIIEHMKNSSLFIFNKDWAFTKLIKQIANSNEFNYIVFIVIILSIIIIAFDNPYVRPNSAEYITLNVCNYGINLFFIIEGILKIISEGFLFKEKTNKKLSIKGDEIFDQIINEINENKQNFDQISEKDKIIVIQKAIQRIQKQKAYIRHPGNILDFFCMILSLIDIIGIKRNLGYLRALRAIRSIRPVRLLIKSENLKLLIKCLIESIPALGNILFVCILYLFLFSIFGMNLYGSTTNTYCSGKLNLSKKECEDLNNEWVYNHENFQNFFYSLKSNFELMLGENWAEMMLFSYEITGEKLTYLFYISAILIGNLFILNLVTSLLIQKFKYVKYKKNQYPDLTNEEKEWLKLQKIMMKYKPVQEYVIFHEHNIWKKKIQQFLESKHFKIAVDILIILSTIELMCQYNGSSHNYDIALEIFNYLFTICFNIELFLRLSVSGVLYFKNSWNIFDFLIVVLCDILGLIKLISYSPLIEKKSKIDAYHLIVRFFKILRLFKIISNFGILRHLFDTVMVMMPSVGNVGLLIGIIIIIYGNIGMNVFGTVPYREAITRTNNFRSFLSSTLVLFRVTSGEDWNNIMNELSYHDCRDPSSEEYKHNYYCYHYNVICYDNFKINYTNIDLITLHEIEDENPDKNELSYHFTCGSSFSYFYFTTFVIIIPVILLNLCTVMVIEGFTDSMNESESILTEEYMNNLIKLWMSYDPLCKLLILPQDFVLIYKQLTPPFGINYDRKINFNPLKFEKNRHQQKIFSKFVNKKEINADALTDFNFNDALLNESYTNLPYAFQFKNFYVSKNGKFSTDDLEVLRILNKFQLIARKDQSQYTNIKQSYTFSNYLDSEDKEKPFYIHYVDACLALSRYAISISYKVDFDNLREQSVNSYVLNKWGQYFNGLEILSLFNQRRCLNEVDSKISTKLASNVLKRVNRIFNMKLIKNPKIIKNKNFWKSYYYFKKKREKMNEKYNKVSDNLPFLNNISINKTNESFISHKATVFNKNSNDKIGNKNNNTTPYKRIKERRLSMFAVRREDKTLTEKIRDSFKFS